MTEINKMSSADPAQNNLMGDSTSSTLKTFKEPEKDSVGRIYYISTI